MINFRTSQRQFIMREILNSISYSNEKEILKKLWSKLRSNKYNHTVRFIKLLKQGIFSDAYPLHDVLLLKL